MDKKATEPQEIPVAVPKIGTKASGNLRRERNISVDLTPWQKQKLKALADESGIKVSDYIRAVVAYAIQEKAVFKLSVQRVDGAPAAA